jgi:hypothetical protein
LTIQRNQGDRAAREAARRQKAAHMKRASVNGYRHELTHEELELVREIRMARATERVASLKVDRLVIELRSRGATWSQIAAALNVSKQGAMKRHAAAVERIPKRRA